MTSPARASIVGVLVMPGAFAVLRLITNSKFGRLLHWKIRRFLALENVIHISPT